MPIYCIGLNYKTANINLREQFAFSNDDISAFLQQFPLSEQGNLASWEEMVILSTCNRVEFYTVVENTTINQFMHTIAEFCTIDVNDFEPVIYQYKDEEAIKHLFTVASGLDSMVIGEAQILGQIKSAFELALSNRTAKKTISKLFRDAIHTGKRVRTETSIGKKSISVPSLAVNLISQKIQNLEDAQTVLLGAGEIAELSIEALRKRGTKNFHIINRTLANAQKLASRWGGKASTLETLADALKTADVLITSTSATEPILTEDIVTNVMKVRKNPNPLVIIDLAVPRDVSPAVGKIDNVELFDIDTVNQEVIQSIATRKLEVPKAEKIISEEIEFFVDYLAIEKVIPIIKKIRTQANHIRSAEVEKALKQMPAMDFDIQEQLESLTDSIINKMLHYPTKRLRAESTGPNRATYSQITIDLFGLEENYE